MADVDLPARPALAVIPDVELVHVGEEWPLASDGTENGTFTPEDLAAAVAAQDDPSVRSPVIKFGHNGDRPPAFGAPVWGRVTNLRLADEGMTLVGDYTGVPIWLAEVLPSAWPSRSIEGKRNHTSDVGRTHGLLITGVSLLGVELPAISTLDDVQAVWSARTPEEAHVTIKETTVTAARSTSITAATTTEDIRRAYYDRPVAGVWSWIREIELDPLTLIVDDDEGGLFRVPVTVAGDEITFGTPESVRVEYVAAGATTSASRAGSESIVYASRTESREGVAGMDPVELRKSLGLDETATDADVMARAAELAARPEPTTDTGQAATPPATPPTPPAPPAPTPDAPSGAAPTITPPPEGYRLVADAVYEELAAGAKDGRTALQTLAKQAEDAFITRHRRRIGPESNPAAKRTEEHLRREWQRNQGEAEAFASILPERMATVPGGHDGGNDDGVANQFDEIVGAVWPGVAAVRAERAKKGS